MGLASGVLQAVQSEHNQQEIAWAARAWAEKLAEPQPLVLVFEDIHWGEEPLLELIEHLGTWVRGVPLLLLCLARPELLDIGRGGAGQVRATAIELEPLGADESEALIDALLDDDEPRRRPAPRCSKRRKGTRSSWRRRSACSPRRTAPPSSGSPTRCRR